MESEEQRPPEEGSPPEPEADEKPLREWQPAST